MVGCAFKARGMFEVLPPMVAQAVMSVDDANIAKVALFKKSQPFKNFTRVIRQFRLLGYVPPEVEEGLPDFDVAP